jgi:hypothetical protein
MADQIDPTEPNERHLTPDDLRALQTQQIRRALGKSRTNPPAALAAFHAAQMSSNAQLLGGHVQRLLEGDLHVADLLDVLRLNDALVADVKLIDRLLGLEQRLDSAAGPNRDRRVKPV